MELPKELQEVILNMHGDTGREWLAALPDMLAEVEARWGLKVGKPYAKLSYNLVLSAELADGRGAVLKLNVPSQDVSNEIKALQQYDGQGYVRLLEHDHERGWMLLEQLRPGTPLSELEEDGEATRVFVDLLHKQQGEQKEIDLSTFPQIAEWAQGFENLKRHFNGGTGPFAAEVVDKAQRLYHELIETTAKPRLLHGDLHHDNMLQAGADEWVIIDPKGIVGDPCYEPIAFLRNYLLDKDVPEQVLATRMDTICNTLGYDKHRVVSWGFAHMVLAAWWNLESKQEEAWKSSVEIAEMFKRLLGKL
ncbi:MAG TPA: aminoglycoside phosphotransferase family protein [Bacilli bacterium]|nr:aminoglycoside phosphotransferase family protein [Bacilli bacterium]